MTEMLGTFTSEVVKAALQAVEDIAYVRRDQWLFEYSQLLSTCVFSDDIDTRDNALESLMRTLTSLVVGF